MNWLKHRNRLCEFLERCLSMANREELDNRWSPRSHWFDWIKQKIHWWHSEQQHNRINQEDDRLLNEVDFVRWNFWWFSLVLTLKIQIERSMKIRLKISKTNVFRNRWNKFRLFDFPAEIQSRLDLVNQTLIRYIDKNNFQLLHVLNSRNKRSIDRISIVQPIQN